MLTGNIVIYNVASQSSGGLRLFRSDATLINNVIADNRIGYTWGNCSGLRTRGSSPRRSGSG